MIQYQVSGKGLQYQSKADAQMCKCIALLQNPCVFFFILAAAVRDNSHMPFIHNKK